MEGVALNSEKLVCRVDELIKLGEEVLTTESEGFNGAKRVDLIRFYKFRSATISFVLKLFGHSHPYFVDFSEKVKDASPLSCKRGIGMLHAVKSEIEQGWLTSTKGLISADIFGDFLEMAEHLLQEGYKDPAAVLIGSALEQHLKNLCVANDIDLAIERGEKLIPKKADVINADLVKSTVYSKLDQKSVTFWLGIRNNAAHGDFEAYNKEQVEFMLSAVSEFMGRTAE
ncbi:hypothetical protein BCV02_01315 [Vibrio breoganii]|nr:hypothetical protein BCV02_01315 [Vibrio breoganii]PML86133.1 hypothetical protein BCT67_01535 [Vibrio breoganii]